MAHFDEASIETARLFFPHAQVDTIRFKTLEKFKKKIADLSYSDAPIAVFVPQDKFKLITGIENHNYFAIYSEKYMKTADNSLKHVSDHNIFIGQEKYDTIKDETSCKLSNKIKMKDIDGEYCCWLSKLPDSTLLRNLRVPQAHDTATGMMIHRLGNSKISSSCQSFFRKSPTISTVDADSRHECEGTPSCWYPIS